MYGSLLIERYQRFVHQISIIGGHSIAIRAANGEIVSFGDRKGVGELKAYHFGVDQVVTISTGAEKPQCARELCRGGK
jgi:hypothetical protein